MVIVRIDDITAHHIIIHRSNGFIISLIYKFLLYDILSIYHHKIHSSRTVTNNEGDFELLSKFNTPNISYSKLFVKDSTKL